MLNLYLALQTVVLYALAWFLVFRNQQEEGGVERRIAQIASIVAVGLQAWYTFKILLASDGVDLALFPIVMLVATTVALISTVEHLIKPSRATPLVLVIYPIIILIVLAAGLLHEQSLHSTKMNVGLVVHVIVSIASYSILSYAACQAVLLMWLDRALRSHSMNAFLRTFQPLESAEVSLFNALWTGLFLLTCATATGFIFFWDKLFSHVSHLHVIITFAAWLLYSLLMVGHVIRGWRGSFTTKLSLSAFSLLLVGYFGTNLVIQLLPIPTT